jgi:glycosyltransferase involved in cell wall biosynthesis
MPCPRPNQLPKPYRGKTGWPWTEESPLCPETTPEGKKWPKVSIITPSFNQGHYIEETIRSVLLQGYPNLEYIIIDGGSSDCTLNIIKKYESWISYWISEPDEGQSDAINKGGEIASGTLMNWINSDDIYLPGVIKHVASAHSKYPNRLIAGHACIFREETEEEYIIHQKKDFTLEKFIRCWTIGERIWSGQPNWFFPTAAFKSCNGLDPTLHFAMDRDILIRMLISRSVIVLDKAISRFRVHKNGKTTALGFHSRIETRLTHSKYLYLLKKKDKREYIKYCTKFLIRNLPGRIKRKQFYLALIIINGLYKLISEYYRK